MNVDVSIINRTLLANYSSSSEEDSSENGLHSGEDKKIRKASDGRITDDELKDLETALLRELTPSQTKQIMEIFRGFREGASPKETENAIVSLSHS